MQPGSSRSGGTARSAGAEERPACPQCRRPMNLKTVAPQLSDAGRDEVTYGCEHCQVELTQTVTRA
jgi:hypothetical protein